MSKFQLLCDGQTEKTILMRDDRCCPSECIAGPGSPISRYNKFN